MITSPTREPIEMVAGDTLYFTKTFSEFTPPAYSLDYEIRGGAAAISFQSSPDPTNTFFVMNVTPAVTALWLPGQMLMAGYLIKTATGDRQTIYMAELTIHKNLQGSNANIQVKTFKQTLLENMETCMANFSVSGLLETRIGETMFRYQTPKDLYFAYGMAYQMRQNEIAMERVRNGRNSGQVIKPRVNITQPGPLAGQVLFPAGWGAS